MRISDWSSDVCSYDLFDMFFLTNRGLYSPAPVFEPSFWTIPAAFGIAIVAVVLLVRWARRRQDATGYRFPALYPSLALLVGLPLLAALATGLPLSWTDRKSVV